ncbi:MAG: hypothetical protein ABIR39_17015 [Nocardioides sp.]|uniref:hypothetical protein n=1 Tax=Nocardioides sp. TaxID=35761 RepID=UPI00326432B7
MNALLKKYGYLSGAPGAYSVTKTGEPFAAERHVSNGVGGYQSMQVNYEVRTWNDDLPAALRAEMEANPDGVAEEEPPLEENTVWDHEPFEDDSSDDVGSRDATWKELAVVGAVLGGVAVVVRYGPPIWNDKVKPAGRKLRDRFSKRDQQEDPPVELVEAPDDTSS